MGDGDMRQNRSYAAGSRAPACARLWPADPFELVRDGIVDSLIVAQLEMQERVVLDRAPSCGHRSYRPQEIDGAGDPASGAPGITSRMRSRMASPTIEKKSAFRYGCPICASRVHVEAKKASPDLFVRFAPVSQTTSMPALSASLRSRRIDLRLREARRPRKSSKWRSRDSPNGIAGRCVAGSRVRRAYSTRLGEEVTCADDNSLAVAISASASASAPRTCGASGPGGS